ncbi:MAG: hypothetical protein KA184_23390, partial [Candidatus Hydrogenedentes bacterium]|nr:hypothetical protein [Candidatus Hydrogenedentota bacterium]
MQCKGISCTTLGDSALFQEGEAAAAVPAIDVLRTLPIANEAPGRYCREGEYARGGMGRVLIVRDGFLGREVAMKELIPCAEQNAPTRELPGAGHHELKRVRRFLQEACITGQLSHPSIVPVYELGLQEDGTPYYTMKFVHGRTFDRAIEDAGT